MPREIATHIWVGALLHRAEQSGAFATVVHSGDAQRGDVLIKVTRERGTAQLYAPAFNPDGPTEFEALPAGVTDAPEGDVDALIARRLTSDRDLWVIEIEDRRGRHFLTETVRR
ncbi:MAG: DUF1491 family protein [Alphaproteobacteria bacterium]|nr:DUF1491 family protein [Alphaproteobacteria bacterium]